MRSVMLLVAGAVVVVAPADAYNGTESLAMHVVASHEYLDCGDLCPADMSCLDVDCDLTLAELEASGGYGCVVFLAYNIDELAMVEFYVVGWPIGPGTPDFDGPYYCAGDSAFVLGEPFEKRGGEGGIVAFPCQRPCSRMYCFCTIRFGPSVYNWLPIMLEYAPSRWSSPHWPSNYVQDCTSFEMGLVYHEHGAVIGGECEPIPNCNPGPTGNEETSWGMIKSLYR